MNKCNVIAELYLYLYRKQTVPLNPVAYGDVEILSAGHIMLTCLSSDQAHSLKFYVMKINVQPLLGLIDYLYMGLGIFNKENSQLL